MKETNWYDISQLAHKHMLLDDQHYGTRWLDRIINFAMEVRQIEREACAKVCDKQDHDGVMIAKDCAAAIRARREK